MHAVVGEALQAALLDNYDELDPEEAAGYVSIEFIRVADVPLEAEDGSSFRWAVADVHIQLPDGADPPGPVIEDFCAAVRESDDGAHVVKFEDDQLLADLEVRRQELYEVEMKLRRVLSIVYLRDRHVRSPYRLLMGDRVSPNRDTPDPKVLQDLAQNEFFYLAFSQYAQLNERAEPKMKDVLNVAVESSDFDEFRAALASRPVADEDDAALIAGLLTRMDAVEVMRNCVAHNREPSARVRENYENALPQLHALLDAYLARCAADAE